jgi:hypothetical protein
MGAVSFSYTTPEKSIGGFVIDAFLSEGYTFSNSVTDIPIEEGSNVADHVVENQDEISIEAFIGNAEFKTLDDSLPEDLADIEPMDLKSRIRKSYQELLRLKREKQPVDVVMGMDTFHDMVITELSISRDVETGADLPFSMQLRHIKIVKSETTQINASNAPETSASDQAAGTSNVGVAAKNKTNDDESLMKQRWRAGVQRGDWTPAEYQAQWGVPYPQ